MGVTVEATLGTDNYYTEVTAGKNSIVTDEPEELGGENRGFNPYEILATSLASCTAATLRMYIDRKKWAAEKIKVTVTLDNFPTEKEAVFKRKLSFEGAAFSAEQLERLHKIADACPVHKILSHNIEFQTTFEDMIEISHETTEKGGQFSASINQQKAGLMTYTWSNAERFIIDHTEVEEAFGGQGVGKEMLVKAVEFAREKGVKIIPLCPFAKATFQKNPDLQDVL